MSTALSYSKENTFDETKDVLAFAYDCCKANGGTAGVDGQTFEDIETYGRERWLDELAQELKSRTYQPLPVRRVYIPKPDRKQRPLGVPAIRDRAAEVAAVLILEPILEADLPPEQYAYRQDRSALDAVRHVHKLVNTGHGEIVDADLSSYRIVAVGVERVNRVVSRGNKQYIV